MSELRIRVKFGEHEIELEGSADAVERQFEPFKQFLMPAPPPPSPKESADEVKQVPTPPRLSLEAITKVRGTIYSLTVNAKVEDAILVILLAQRIFRNNNSVSGIEIMKGLRDSGFQGRRVDMILN